MLPAPQSTAKPVISDKPHIPRFAKSEILKGEKRRTKRAEKCPRVSVGIACTNEANVMKATLSAGVPGHAKKASHGNMYCLRRSPTLEMPLIFPKVRTIVNLKKVRKM
jgi:hypothetical protein